MVVDLGRKNELEILELRGDLKLLDQKLDTIKNNDLSHIQKSLDNAQKFMWAVGFMVLGHLGVAVKTALWG
jgi:hypothetical protein|tara:strand:- start:3702 stop:3914 length:213 start_codon:yes stop_codon:yes gene_type:complete